MTAAGESTEVGSTSLLRQLVVVVAVLSPAILAVELQLVAFASLAPTARWAVVGLSDPRASARCRDHSRIADLRFDDTRPTR